MASSFETSFGAGVSTEEGSAVVTASGEVVRESSTASENVSKGVVEVPKKKSYKSSGGSRKSSESVPVVEDKVITVSEDKLEVAKQVIDSLNASAERTAKADYERQVAFNEQLVNNVRSGNVLNPALAGFGANANRNNKEQEALMSSERFVVDQVADNNFYSGAETPNKYFMSSKAGKEYLLDNSPVLNKLLPTQAEKEIFVNTENPDFSGFGKALLFNTGEQYEILGSALKDYKSNREIIANVNAKYGVEPQNQQLKKIGLFVESANPSNVYPVPNNRVKEDELIANSFKGVVNLIGSNVKEGVKDIGEGKYVSIGLKDKDNPVGRGGDFVVKVFPDGVPSASSVSGAGMVAYSGATLITNSLGVIGKVGTEAVDVGLALPDYANAVINPTPYNKAVANAELIDVAVDFIPVGTPNVNVNAEFNAVVSKDVNTKYGVNKINDVRNSNGGFKTAFNSPELNNPTSNAVVEIDLNQNVNNAVVGVVSELGNVNPNVNANINIVDLPVRNKYKSSNSNRNVNANAEININEGFNANAEININEDLNINQNVNLNQNVNVNANVNAYANVNANLNQNVNANLNMNVFKPRFNNSDKSTSLGLFQARAKVKGVFDKVGLLSKTKEGAFASGFGFVQNNSSRTFGVEDVKTGEFVDVNKKTSFKKKKTKRGVVFIEPSRFAINSFGEKSQIKRKFRRVKL